MRHEDAEVPFPQPMDALLDDPRPHGPDAVGWLTFIDPKISQRASVPVTVGPTRDVPGLGAVWHIDISTEDRSARTSPSIHWPDAWHTPSPCLWRIVDRLADEEATQ